MVRRFCYRFRACKSSLIQRGDFWLPLRISDAESLAELVAESSGGAIEAFAEDSPSHQVTLDQLRALAIERCIAFLFRHPVERGRHEQSAHICAIASCLECSHLRGELQRLFLELSAWQLTELFHQWIDFRRGRNRS